MLSKKEIKQIPFRSDKVNVAPDNELCNACGRCCKRFSHIQLLPIDFKLENLKEELEILLEMKLVNLVVYPGYYPAILFDKKKGCKLLTKDGCMLAVDVRPVTCGQFFPGLDSIGRRRCKSIPSEWYNELPYEMKYWSKEQIDIMKSLVKK